MLPFSFSTQGCCCTELAPHGTWVLAEHTGTWFITWGTHRAGSESEASMRGVKRGWVGAQGFWKWCDPWMCIQHCVFEVARRHG